jgi:hypothetical protein
MFRTNLFIYTCIHKMLFKLVIYAYFYTVFYSIVHCVGSRCFNNKGFMLKILHGSFNEKQVKYLNKSQFCVSMLMASFFPPLCWEALKITFNTFLSLENRWVGWALPFRDIRTYSIVFLLDLLNCTIN